MPDNKKHHYVPKFLLKRFSDSKKTINLYVISKENKVVGANLSNQCYRDYFYGTDPAPERGLGALETNAAVILEEIGRTATLPDNSSDRFSLLIFLVFQRARTLSATEELNDLSERTMKEVLATEIERHGLNSSDFRIHLNEPALFSLEMALKTYPLLVDLDMRLLHNATDEGFILSDNPVVLYNQLFNFNANSSNIGFACKGLQIFMPIDDKHAILFYDSDVYQVPGTSWSTVQITDKRDVYSLNVLQICSASNVIYFRNSDQNIKALHRKAEPFLHPKNANIQTINVDRGPERKSKLIMMSRPQVRTNLSLSFMRISGSAKRWRDWFRSPGLRPTVAVRNEHVIADHEEFLQLVEKGEMQCFDFFKFVGSKHGERGAQAQKDDGMPGNA